MFKRGKGLYDGLKKEGKGLIQIELEASPSDDQFSKTPPSCEVCISYKCESGDGQEENTVCKTILVGMDKEDRTIEMEVETVISTLDRMLHIFSKSKLKPKALPLVVTVTPTENWKKFYNANSFQLTVSAGAKEVLPVSLESKKNKKTKDMNFDIHS